MTVLVDRGAYAEAVSATRAEGREPKLEKTLAAVMLERAATSTDSERRRRAFTELSLAGTRSRPVLDRLSEAKQPLMRALAWKAALQLGDDSTRNLLRALASSPDPELSALGVEALKPDSDRPQLLATLTLPNNERRAAAIRVLSRGERSSEVETVLEDVARRDPEPAVRALALSALGKQGIQAAAAIERGLDDEAEAVRIAAFSALANVLPECPEQPTERCDRERLSAKLGRDLGSPPTPQSLAAAAAVLRLPASSDTDRSREVFTRALESGDPKLRGRAAVLCRAVPAPGCDAITLRLRLREEPVANVKLLVALAIGPRDPLAHTALEILSNDSDTATAIEAASELAAIGDASARQKLVAALQHKEPQVRVSALRALGRLAAAGSLDDDSVVAERVVDRLADRDERVRVAAAAAVL